MSKCAGCGGELGPDCYVVFGADADVRVCSGSCGFDVLANGVVTGDGSCLTCGEGYAAGRIPRVDGYDEELCVRCATGVERRAPRRTTA